MTDPAQLYAQATAAYNRKEWRKALDLVTRLLPKAPDHGELHYLAGLAALELQQMPQALEYLHRAAKLHPARADYLAQFAKALSIINLTAKAIPVANRALTLTPLDAPTLDILGVIFMRANAHERARSLYERAVALAPNHPHYRYNLAKSLEFLGHLDGAERELEICVGLNGCHWGAHLKLSQLRKQNTASNHLERLHALLPKTTENSAAQMNLHLALAKEYEDLTDYSKAFEHLVAGKSAAATQRDYSPKRDEALFEAITRASPKSQPASAGFPTEEPIFVVGMPRSGTTLVDRIISSHPDVHSAGELKSFPLALKVASGNRTSHLIDADIITRAQDVDWRRLGEDYLTATRPDTGRKPRFIDKLPHNFLYVGAIANALPNAKIICLRRDPMDTCLSNFRQLFAPASPYHDYSYDLLNTGRYYILFDRLMTHWKREFPGRILDVGYETLVDTQEASSRQLLEFCGLPWNDACLNFERNQAPVSTASAVQVREPIYRSAIERWKHYEAQLADLRELLSNAGIVVDP
jgi:tetratricopeptide (TPR) repeat protein